MGSLIQINEVVEIPSMRFDFVLLKTKQNKTHKALKTQEHQQSPKRALFNLNKK